MNLFATTVRSFWPRYFLCSFKWYRRWYGGRWEYHWIDVCCSAMWLEMRHDRKWPEYRQPCSFGTPTVEDYPYRYAHKPTGGTK